MKFNVVLILCVILLVSACQGANISAKARAGNVAEGELAVTVPPQDPEPQPNPPSVMKVIPHPNMVGLCASACNDTACGPPVLLAPGFNQLEVPGGFGQVYLTFFPWSKEAAPAPTVHDAASMESYHFFQGPWTPSASRDLLYYLEVSANSRPHAESRRLAARDMYAQIQLGNNPGPVPNWLRQACFTSWFIVQDGANAGDLILTAARPGSQVDQWTLMWNGVPGYADLSNSVVTTIGDWQVVVATVDAADINHPTPGVEVTNDFGVVFDTDVGDVHEGDYEYTVELN